MIPNNLAKDYQAFFDQAESGAYFIEWLLKAIDTAHEEAEKNPELARDHAQRAKGMRDVLNHIKTTGTEVKKGKS